VKLIGKKGSDVMVMAKKKEKGIVHSLIRGGFHIGGKGGEKKLGRKGGTKSRRVPFIREGTNLSPGARERETHQRRRGKGKEIDGRGNGLTQSNP